MAAFAVDPDRLSDIVEQIALFEQRLDSALEEVSAKVDRLHVTWTGDAAERQADAHKQWQRGAGEMSAALAVLRRIATTANTNYTGAVSTNVTMWGQLS